MVQLPRLDLPALHPEHRRELARVRGEHEVRSGLAVEHLLQVLQCVGVHDGGDLVGQRGGELVTGRGAAPRAHHPGLHPPGSHDLGVLLADPVGDGGVTDVAHHPGQPAGGTGDGEQPRARVRRAAGSDPDDPAGVLVVVRPGHAQEAAHVGGLQALDRRLGQVQPDVDELHGTARLGRRVDQVASLVGAERDRQVGPHVRLGGLTGVDVHAAGGVHRHHRHALEQGQRRGRRVGEPRATTDAHDPVDHHVGPLAQHAWCTGPAPGRRERRQPALVRRPAEQPRLHTGSAPGEQGSGVQGVAAVVPRPHQQHDPSAVGRPEPVGHGPGQSVRRTLHQRPLGQPRHQRALRRPDLLDRVRPPHAAKRSRLVWLSAGHGPR